MLIKNNDIEMLGQKGMTAGNKWGDLTAWRRAGSLPFSRMSIQPSIVVEDDVILNDVSFWNGNMNFSTMASAGSRGCIIRAGQNTWPDTKFEENYGKAQGVIPRGSYFYYDSRANPKTQAALWASMLSNDFGELDHAADYEEQYGGTYAGWVNLYIFMNEFQQMTGLPDDRLPLYTGYYYWLSSGKAPIGNEQSMAWFKKHRLWIAWYTTNPSYVKIPQPWDAETLLRWQNGVSPEGNKYGSSGENIDVNKHVHGDADYVSFYDLGGTTPPPPDGLQPYTTNVTVTQTGYYDAQASVEMKPLP